MMRESAQKIEGVILKPLKVLHDDRGFLMEMLRCDDPFFERFGQVYVTCCAPGVAKAWHYHKEQTDHFVCMKGRALVVLYDPRPSSPSRGEIMEVLLGAPPGGGGAPQLLRIPAGVVHGFAATQGDEAWILNVPNRPYRYDSPDEFRLPWNSPEVPYTWPADTQRGG
jgi:dTDP-4-dehydrorhamnose 3,5-epimerase